MSKRKYFFAGSLAVLSLFLGGCATAANNSQRAEQAGLEANQKRLFENQPPVRLDWSLERDNINKRTELWNNPEKVSYIYLINYGKVMAFYTIKGKVSSVNSWITTSEQIIDDPNGDYSAGSVVLEAPSEDGSYGSNGDAIFFFTTDNVYVEWAGDYMLADQPLKLTQPAELVREIE